MDELEINKVKYKSKLPELILSNYGIYLPAVLIMLVLFSLSDLYIHKNINFVYTRIVPAFLCISLLIVKFTPLKANVNLVIVLNNLLCISILMMGVLFIIMTFKTELFQAAIFAHMIFTVIVLFVAKGKKSILAVYLLPFIFIVVYFSFVIQPEIREIQVLMNPFAIYIAVLLVSIRQEQSRFNEFFYKESLISEKEKTEDLYHETSIQNSELQHQKEEILSINEQIEQRKEELQINLEVISDLNRELKRKNKSVTDSINYASRIQDAILPSEEKLNKVFNDYFILYKPCDIVSGDFYWLYTCDDYDIIATGDCTGHGVPGGFMSMLGFSLLNDVVQNCSLAKANEILNRLKEKLKESLNQNNEQFGQTDGLDIALCLVDKKRKVMQFAGAYMPLLILRNSELINIKGDKMPIGRFVKEIPSFTNHEIPLMPNDKFYLFTDGYQDQIGGPEQKRFLSTNMRKLILEISNKPFEEQRNILDSTFGKWKGKHHQMDDVLVLGFQIK